MVSHVYTKVASFFQKTRITLKIDVPYNEHSHIIGREGKNTQSVMKGSHCFY